MSRGRRWLAALGLVLGAMVLVVASIVLRPLSYADAWLRGSLWRAGVRSQYVEVNGLRIHYFEATAKDGEPGTIVISAGGEENTQHTHTVTSPVHVYHKNARGAISEEVNIDEVVEITSNDDPRITFLHFTPAS